MAGPAISHKQADLFSRAAQFVSRKTGHALSFSVAVFVILLWATTGPLFQFSDRWQLIINSTTTIVTFLMVFIIQNQQTRDSEAIHIKLDELLRAVKGAKKELLDLEELSEEDLHKIQQEYEKMARKARGETA